MEFIELINSGMFAQDNSIRSNAESLLIQYKTHKPNEFFFQSAEVLASESVQHQTRIAAGTLLKRCIGLNQGWLLCSLEVRSKIKHILLQLLIAPDPLIKRAAANCISSICALELPRGEWPDIISNLVTNVRHDSIEIRKAAIMTLGYTCEALKNAQLSYNESQGILYGICHSMQSQNRDITLLAIKALQDSLAFMEPHLRSQNERVEVTRLLLELAISQDLEVRQQAIQCLIDYSKATFDYIDTYIHLLWNCLSTSINDDSDLAIPAMEVMHMIAQEVIDRTTLSNRTNMTVKVPHREALASIQQPLIEAVLKNLLHNFRDDDDDESNIQEAAYKTVATLSEALGQSIYQTMLAFVENTINAQEWEKRQAALLAYCALIETTDNTMLLQSTAHALNQFIFKLQDPHKRVRLAASRLISKVCENYPSSLLLHQSSTQHVDLLVTMCNSGPQNISKNLIQGLSMLTASLRQQECELKKFIEPLIQSIARVTHRGDIQEQDSQIIDHAWVCIMNLIDCLENKDRIVQYLDEFAAQLQTTYSLTKWRKLAMQQGLLSAIHVGLLGLSVKQFQPSMEFTQKFYKVAEETFKVNGVTSDGILLVAALAQVSKKQFNSLAGPFIHSYLEDSLKQVQEPELFKSAVTCLSDIARSLLEGFTPYLQIMDYLISQMNNPLLQRDLQLNILYCLSDIILATGTKAEKYYTQTLKMILMGFQSGIQFSQARNPLDQDYAEALNETLIYSYMCMLHAFHGHKVHAGFLDTVSNILLFIQQTSDKNLTPTVDYIRQCANCLLDIVNYYKATPGKQELVLQLLNSDQLKGLLELLQKYKDTPENMEALKYAADQYRGFNMQFNI